MHYAYDTVALAKGTGSAVVKQGGKSWFFLTADYAFGHSLETDTAARGQGQWRHGGWHRAHIRCRHRTSPRSCSRRRSSKAQILGLANAGGDTINSIKAAKEFGITKNMKIAGLLMFINDVHSLGLKNTEGLLMTDSWYWDMNDDTRKVGQPLLRQDEEDAEQLAGGRLLGSQHLPEGGGDGQDR